MTGRLAGGRDERAYAALSAALLFHSVERRAAEARGRKSLYEPASDRRISFGAVIGGGEALHDGRTRFNCSPGQRGIHVVSGLYCFIWTSPIFNNILFSRQCLLCEKRF